MKKEDTPLVIGFKRLSWLIGIAGAVICFLAAAPYYYAEDVALAALAAGGAAFGFARVLVLVVRGFRVGNDKELKVITGFKRLSWLGTFFFTALTGLIVAFYNEPAYGFAAAFITGIIVFPVFRFLVVWIVKGFASGKSAEKKIGFGDGGE
jgi:hypothetical protein